MQAAFKVTFLGSGTSSGVPMIGCNCEVCTSTDVHDKRLRSSIMVETKTTTIVIDTTPDFRYQMLRENVKKLDGVVYTHSHKDHVAGLDDIRAFNFFQHTAISVYATLPTQAALKKEFAYIFAEEKYPGIPDLILHTIDKAPFTIGDIRLLPIKSLHLNMPVLGFRIGDFVYITDANYIAAAEMDKIKGAKVLVLNALRREKHISHFTLEEASAIADETAVPQAYFTHISHQMGRHEITNAMLPHGRALAHDGMTLEFK